MGEPAFADAVADDPELYSLADALEAALLTLIARQKVAADEIVFALEDVLDDPMSHGLSAADRGRLLVMANSIRS